MLGISSCGVVDVPITATVGIDVVLCGSIFLIFKGFGVSWRETINGSVQPSKRVDDINIGESLVSVVGDDDFVGDGLPRCGDGCIGPSAINIDDLLIDDEIWIQINWNLL